MTAVKSVTNTQQILVRDWNDLDPKVRNAIFTAIPLLLADLAGALAGKIVIWAAIVAAIGILLPIVAAYVTTSKHKDLIITDIKAGIAVAEMVKPDVALVAPELTPVIETAEDLARAVASGDVLNAETTTIPIIHVQN